MTGFETSSKRRPRATLSQEGYGLIPIKLRGPGLQLAVRCGSTTYLHETDSLGPRGPKSGRQANRSINLIITAITWSPMADSEGGREGGRSRYPYTPSTVIHRPHSIDANRAIQAPKCERLYQVRALCPSKRAGFAG